MKVRNGMIKDVANFVLKVHGKDAYEKWVQSLDSAVKEEFLLNKFKKTWYDSIEYFVEPTGKLCEMFYESCSKGARETGRWGVAHWLKGPMGLLVKIFPEKFVIKHFLIRALDYYYGIVDARIIELKKGKGVFCVLGLDETQGFVAERFVGGFEKYLELKGYSKVNVTVEHSLKEHKLYTVIEAVWKK